jgi:hypothetical protein
MRADGVICFRPSELGKCIRGHVAAFQGHEPEPIDKKTLRIMHQGEIHEKHIAYDAEQEYGGRILRQVRLYLPIEDWGIIEGTCDGIWFPSEEDYLEALSRFEKIPEGPWHDPDIYYLNKPYSKNDTPCSIFGFEAKASAPSMFSKMSANGPTEVYSYQYSIYWAMIEHTLNVKLDGYMFAIGNRLDGDRCFHLLESPKYTKEQILDRCREIRAALNDDLTCNNSISCDEEEYAYNCKWWRVHKDLELNNPDESNKNSRKSKSKKYVDFDPSFENLIIADHILSNKISELESQKEEIRLSIESSLRGRQKVTCGAGTISLVEGRKAPDEEAIVKEHPELVSQFTVFDVDAAVKANPELKNKYSKKVGKDYLMIRVNEKSIEKTKIQARMQEMGIIEEALKRKTYQESLANRESEAFLNDLLDIKNEPGFH